MGQFELAERMARAAVDLVADTDWCNDQANALMDRAEIVGITDRRAEATELTERALGLYEAKENLVGADRARRLLAELGP